MEMWQLQQRQSLPLDAKIVLSKKRIRQWYDHWRGQVYVSFSGGKDSTVLLHLVRSLYPEVPAVFVDTGLEYPEIRDFVKTVDNVIWLKPEKTFKDVLKEYGYPVVSKTTALKLRQAQTLPHDGVSYNLRMTGVMSDGNASKVGKIPEKWKFLVNAPFAVSEKCCDVTKKKPLHVYFRKSGRYAYVGTMASDSELRKRKYLQNGCNAFELTKPISMPLSFWNEKDVWDYLLQKNIPYCEIYKMGEERTGCMFCMFGVHMEDEPNRFQRMQISHPKQWRYCMENLGLDKVLDYIGVSYHATSVQWWESVADKIEEIKKEANRQ